ncbi:MAG: family 16 glycosylhydrolase [Clostridia bacterium]|nr:family 16 glycosylhydrolase [Clostridia bacterium]
MNQLKRILCLVLAVMFVFACVGCADTPASNPTGNNGSEHRPPYQSEDEVVTVAFEDKDHLFDYKTEKWDGPEGYVIVVPQGNTEAMKSAKYLQKYFKDAFGVSLTITTDSTEAKDKEILIGKTSREASNTTLGEAEMKVSLKGSKLVFDGGHDVTVDMAVKKFVRVTTKVNEAATFSLETDFESTLDNKYEGQYAGYNYVWGEEFEGVGIGSSWFQLIAKMAGSDRAEVSKEKNVVDVNDGRLKLHALSYFNNNREGTEYRIPCSTVTHETMNFKYGYAEIRARVPYKWGCFPSWWTQSTAGVCGYRTKDIMFEVDIFEIFNAWEKTPNLIQWYEAGFDYGSKYPNCWKLKELGVTPKPGEHQSIADCWVGHNDQLFKWEENPNLSNEYHTYGYEWTPTEIKMTIDGKEHAVFDISQPRDSYNEAMLPGTNSPIYFHDPQGFIFNNHIFLDGVSLASASVAKYPKSLPAAFYIDWIRLYQKDDNGSKIYFDDQRDYLS